MPINSEYPASEDPNAVIYISWVNRESFRISNIARGIWKKAFSDIERLNLPAVHPVNGLTDSQIYQILRTLRGKLGSGFDLRNCLTVETLGRPHISVRKNIDRTIGFRKSQISAKWCAGCVMREIYRAHDQYEADRETTGAMHMSDESEGILSVKLSQLIQLGSWSTQREQADKSNSSTCTVPESRRQM